ncbi:proteasome assembly chaperone family protein [Halobium salinum]|uniref:Proteasome assembly chaperone family protein n=1 Tax=Halobium salinum TaxID=1364940 RepID=A0ABD5PJR6_9EURY|nr:PAC2 family protein [Halobium salinum]
MQLLIPLNRRVHSNAFIESFGDGDRNICLMSPEPTFEVVVDESYRVDGPLFVGLANVGMAGVSALDYLVRQFDAEQVGHVRTRNLPDITPFSGGEPRHAMRLYDIADPNITVLLSELFVPAWAADPFADGVLNWIGDVGVEELTVLHGVPIPHGPDEHKPFYVADSVYRNRRIGDHEITALGGGFFDGVVGELVTRSLDAETPPLGVLVTPSHPPGPDLDAALLFLDTLQELYGFTADQESLQRLSAELKRYYTELADRVKTIDDSRESVASRDFPEDRMFM